MTTTRAVVALAVSRVEYLLTSPWLIGAIALLALSSGTVAVTGAKDLTEHRERYALEIQQRLRASLLSVGPTGRQAERALRVVRPPTEAALLIPGQERSMPAAWDLGPATVEALPPYPDLALRPSIVSGGGADGAAIIGQFGGTLALALGLATVLRDRRRGWGDAERHTAAPAFAFVVAHLSSACLTLAVAVAAWFAAIGLAVSQANGHDWADANQTLWMLAPLTWLYAVTLYGYGAAIAWQVRVPLRAVVCGALLWLGLFMVGPQLGASWVGWSNDASSRASAEQDQRDAYAERVRLLEAELGRQIAARVGDARLSSEKESRAIQGFQALEPMWIRGMVGARAAADDLQHFWRAGADRTTQRLQQAARFMPSTLLPVVLAEVSGTGHLTRRRWEQAVTEYKRRLDQALFDNRPTVTLRLPLDGLPEVFMHIRHPVLPIRDLPSFVPPSITPEDRWQSSATAVLILALHAAAALMFAGVAQRRAWRRYDFVSVSAIDNGRP